MEVAEERLWQEAEMEPPILRGTEV